MILINTVFFLSLIASIILKIPEAKLSCGAKQSIRQNKNMLKCEIGVRDDS